MMRCSRPLRLATWLRLPWVWVRAGNTLSDLMAQHPQGLIPRCYPVLHQH